LRARFFSAVSARDRARLGAELSAFVVRFPDDERSDSARILLAWLEIDRKDYAKAQSLIAEARPRSKGAGNDFLNVAQAAILTRTGSPEQALKLLAPLDKKIIDQDERSWFGEQRVLASIAAERHEAAVNAMLAWLAQAAPDARERVQVAVNDLLSKVPRDALVRSLHALDKAASEHPESSPLLPARSWLRKTLRERLTTVALHDADPELARNLLEGAPASARTSESGLQLGRIAANKVGTPLIAGRSVGLVLGIGNAQARRRSARVAAGMSRALDILTSAADASQVRLVTRDDAAPENGTERALSELAGEGAAILVAGVDADGATRAHRYAEASRIPVIVLTFPEPLAENLAYTFVLGSSLQDEQKILTEELERRALQRPVTVGTPELSCDRVPSSAGAARFPIDEWRKAKTDAVILLGSADCARDVLAELRALRERPRVLVGLEASSLLVSGELNDADCGLKAGLFPHKTRPAGAAKPLAQGNEPPLDWYEALGHDAALLAKAALSSLPLTRVEDARQVAEMHVRAERSLQSASAKLWSTEKLGFLGKHVLERNLAIASKANVK
jgi:hypothetical protein